MNSSNGKISSKEGKVARSIPPSLPLGSLVYYPFDETSGLVANDESGNGRDGALNGGVSWGSGYLNWSSSNGYVDIPALGLDNIDDPFSVSVWLNPSNTAGYRMIVSNGTGAVSASGRYFMYLAITNMTNLVDIRVGKAQVGGVSKSSGVGLSASTWTHLVFTYDGTGLASSSKLYFNGSETGLNDSGTIAVSSVTAVDDWAVGTYSGVSKGTLGWTGFQDNFLVYGRVLNAGEVATIYGLGR